ncbi:MAG: NAD(P)/FAD-dependent oxidoreductase, partial [Gemmatimonadaceae bacterium]|nr:NAD(P)/FAD-dependent oxidoreductase [Gemmatimonadaceae bacterium]
MPPTSNRRARVLIVGSGFSGVAMAIALRKSGITEIVILERAATMGGTWRDNAYPGCACDVESVLYSLSFAPNPAWSRTFSPQAEIRSYLERVAIACGIVPLIRFGEEVTGAAWDESAKNWTVQSTTGVWTADVVVLANGALSDPKLPSIAGLNEFAGPLFHTARWDASVALAGKRVAVVGTGASAVQVIPAIQPRVQHLTVFQRTPPWVMPRNDREVPGWQRRLFRTMPACQRALRMAQYLRHELLFLPFRHRWARRIAEGVIGLHLKRQVADPALRRALTPRYAIGCKRLLLSDDFYPAMTQPNVSLVTSPIVRVTTTGVVTEDGAEHPADVLVLATGFRVTDWLLAPVICGRDGRTLADVWQGSPKAHLGTSVAGFPNLFTLMGPNTGLGHSSVLMMAEAQIAHVVALVAECARRGARAVEPTAEAQAQFVRWMDESLRTTVWNSGGCAS